MNRRAQVGDEKLVSFEDLKRRFGITTSRPTLARWEAEGRFPARIKKGSARSSRVLWRENEILAWLDRTAPKRLNARIRPEDDAGPFPGTRWLTPREVALFYVLLQEAQWAPEQTAERGVRLYFDRGAADPKNDNALYLGLDAGDGVTALIAMYGPKGWKARTPDGEWNELPPIKEIAPFVFNLVPAGAKDKPIELEKLLRAALKTPD